MRGNSSCALVFFWVSGFASDIPAGNVFVSPSGTGSSCTQSSPCSLSTALGTAAAGSMVYLAQGTYTGTGTAVASIGKNLTLYGGWDGKTSQPPVRDPKKYVSSLDGQNRRRAILIQGAASVTVDGLTITRGNAAGDGAEFGAGGGLRATLASVIVRNCTITRNVGSSRRGGIGGGLSLTSCQTRIENSTIDGNIAGSSSTVNEGGSGGGVYATGGSLAVRQCTVSNNFAYKGKGDCGGAGGGFFLSDLDTARIERCTIRGNAGSLSDWASDGGGIWVGNSKNISIAGNRIENNWTSKHATMGAGYGGGIALYDSTATISGNTILGNSAGTWTAAVRPGGGVAIVSKLVVTLVNNIITQNDGGSFGGGVYVGRYNPPAGKTILLHNTIVANGENGVLLWYNARVSMKNNVLAGQTEGMANRSPTTASLSADHTVLWNTTDTLTGKNAIQQDPLLSADDHLLSGSPAINAGMKAGIASDIDGQARDANPDIGADEYVEGATSPIRR